MSNIKCIFCNTEFCSISSLNNHQKKTKYCLFLQGKITKEEKEFKCCFCSKILSSKQNLEIHLKKCEIIEEIEIEFRCLYCAKLLSTKQKLQYHMNICLKKKEKDFEEQLKEKEKDFEEQLKEKEKDFEEQLKEKEKDFEEQLKEKEKEFESFKKEKDREIKFLNKENDNFRKQIDKKEDEITDFKDRIERMGTIAIKKPTTTNKTINHLELNQVISQDHINNKITSKFNDQYITNGMKGIVDFVDDHIIKLDNGSYIYGCYDHSRKMFKYKDNDGNEVKDPGAGKLIKMIQPGLLDQTKVLHQYFDNECSILEREEQKNGRLTNEEQKELKKMKFLKESANKTGFIIQTMHENPEFPNKLSNVRC
jgi:hypothetical protein